MSERDVIVTKYKRKWPLILVKRILEFLRHPKRTLKYFQDMYYLNKSGLFDYDYYLRNNHDLYLSTPNLVRHFLLYGYREERKPSQFFDIAYYYKSYPEVKASGINPVVYYYRYGKKNGQRCYPLPDEAGNNTTELNRIIKEDIANNPGKYLTNALSTNEYSLIKSSGLFDEAYYCELYSPLLEKEIDPIVHYCVLGWTIGCTISRKYDFEAYRTTYIDVAHANINPLLHYLKSGRHEGRKLFLFDYDGSREVRGTIDKRADRNRKILEYRKRRGVRGIAQTVLYTYRIQDDDWIYEDINNDWDYVCFVDDESQMKLDGIWEYRLADYYAKTPAGRAAYYKYHPHYYLNQYEYSIWVDPEIKRPGIKLSRMEPAISDGRELILFNKTVVDKNFYAKEEEVKDSLSESYSLIRGDSRILVRRNNVPWIKKLDLLTWNTYGKFNLEETFFKLHFIIVDIDHCHTMNGVSDTLITCHNLSNLELNAETEKINLPLEPCLSYPVFPDLSVSIVIPIFNALEDVIRCVESVEKNTTRPHSLVLADDCSREDTKKWLRKYKQDKENVYLIDNEENLGYTKNVNNGVKLIPADFTIILNSDTIVPSRWVEKLLNTAYSEDSIGIVGPLSNAASWQTVPDVRKVNDLPLGYGIDDINKLLERNRSTLMPKSDIINGFCYGVKKEVFDSIGFFDDSLFPRGFGEEDDFTLRARMRGFQCVIATDTYVFHAKSKSFGHEQRLKLASESRVILDEKYGKENLENITHSLRYNPILKYYKELIAPLYDESEIMRTQIGEPICYIPPNKNSTFQDNRKIAVHLHLYYIEMRDYFYYHLQKFPLSFDLFISICNESEQDSIRDYFSKLENVNTCECRSVVNRGRDLAPMIVEWGTELLTYDYALHIHSKKSIHDWKMGKKWLDYMMESLLFSSDYIEALLQKLGEEETLGFISPPVPKDLYNNYTWRNDKVLAKEILDRLNIDDSLLEDELYFPAGCFFWFKPEAMKDLLSSSISYDDFPAEPIGTDGTWAHAIERLMFLLGKKNGYSFLTCKPVEEKKKDINDRFIDVDSVYNAIVKAIEEKRPFALIRYFDGEGAFYNIQSRESRYVDERMKYYFGDLDYTDKDIDIIAKGITESVSNADIVGTVPPQLLDELLEFASNEVGTDYDKLPFIRKRYDDVIDCDGVWRILSADELVRDHIGENSFFCSKDIHYEMVYTGLIYRLLDILEEVTIITSQPVKEALSTYFDLNVIHLEIPQRAFDNESDDDTVHYPTFFEEVLKELNHDLSGRVFLVGAGPLGKIYCNSIKNSGGIVLDLGAVFDSWVNFYSRPEHSESRLNTSIDKRLLLSSVNLHINHLGITNIENVFKGRINPYVMREAQYKKHECQFGGKIKWN